VAFLKGPVPILVRGVSADWADSTDKRKPDETSVDIFSSGENWLVAYASTENLNGGQRKKGILLDANKK
jgi:hypothetical protein